MPSFVERQKLEQMVKTAAGWKKFANTPEGKKYEQNIFNREQANKLAALGPLAKGGLTRNLSANNLAKAAANAEAAYAAGAAVKYARKSRRARRATRRHRKATRRAGRR